MRWPRRHPFDARRCARRPGCHGPASSRPGPPHRPWSPAHRTRPPRDVGRRRATRRQPAGAPPGGRWHRHRSPPRECRTSTNVAGDGRGGRRRRSPPRRRDRRPRAQPSPGAPSRSPHRALWNPSSPRGRRRTPWPFGRWAGGPPERAALRPTALPPRHASRRRVATAADSHRRDGGPAATRRSTPPATQRSPSARGSPRHGAQRCHRRAPLPATSRVRPPARARSRRAARSPRPVVRRRRRRGSPRNRVGWHEARRHRR